MARGDDIFSIRFPDGVRQRVKALAALNRRSMNAEVVLALAAWLTTQQRATAEPNIGPAPRIDLAASQDDPT